MLLHHHIHYEKEHDSFLSWHTSCTFIHRHNGKGALLGWAADTERRERQSSEDCAPPGPSDVRDLVVLLAEPEEGGKIGRTVDPVIGVARASREASVLNVPAETHGTPLERLGYSLTGALRVNSWMRPSMTWKDWSSAHPTGCAPPSPPTTRVEFALGERGPEEGLGVEDLTPPAFRRGRTEGAGTAPTLSSSGCAPGDP
jgi:hypothetical protein